MILIKYSQPTVLWFLFYLFIFQISGNQQFFAVNFLLQNFASLQEIFWKKNIL